MLGVETMVADRLEAVMRRKGSRLDLVSATTRSRIDAVSTGFTRRLGRELSRSR
jgi:hypothetical protein